MSTMTTTNTTPRVWIGCLACYNEGRLVGDWFDAVGADDITTNDIHGAHSRADNHDELWCFDHENIPARGEFSPQDAAEWGEVLTAVSDDQRAALYAWVRSGDYSAQGDSDLPVVSDFEERYCGQWESFSEYARHLADDVGLLADVPDEIVRYFDWKSWVADQQHDYNLCDSDSGVYVFRNY